MNISKILNISRQGILKYHPLVNMRERISFYMQIAIPTPLKCKLLWHSAFHVKKCYLFSSTHLFLLWSEVDLGSSVTFSQDFIIIAFWTSRNNGCRIAAPNRVDWNICFVAKLRGQSSQINRILQLMVSLITPSATVNL